MRERTSTAIVLTLAALLTAQPAPLWADGTETGTGTTDVTVRQAGVNDAQDVESEASEDVARPLDQTGTSHLPTLLLAGGALCGGAAVALRKRKRIANGGDGRRC